MTLTNVVVSIASMVFGALLVVYIGKLFRAMEHFKANLTWEKPKRRQREN